MLFCLFGREWSLRCCSMLFVLVATTDANCTTSTLARAGICGAIVRCVRAPLPVPWPFGHRKSHHSASPQRTCPHHHRSQSLAQGTIAAVRDDGSYNILYCDGDRESSVERQRVRPLTRKSAKISARSARATRRKAAAKVQALAACAGGWHARSMCVVIVLTGGGRRET